MYGGKNGTGTVLKQNIVMYNLTDAPIKQTTTAPIFLLIFTGYHEKDKTS